MNCGVCGSFKYYSGGCNGEWECGNSNCGKTENKMFCKICGLTPTSCKCDGPEVILHAAVKSADGRIFFGKSHADCFHKALAMNTRMSSKADDQGFLTSKGNYLIRSEAAKLAFERGQIDRKTGYLFSEDMWSDEYKGKYHHDEIEGYVLR